jgi:diguanylate cyclase (GGDEF)-like protein/PAS domain S-box-containing protein
MSDASQRAAQAEALIAEGLQSVDQLSIVFFDREMRILAVHGGAARQHGYLPERIVGHLAPDVLPAAAWERLGRLYTRALTGETVTVDLPSYDGTAVYETTFRPVTRDSHLLGGMAVSRDVTAERRLERELADLRSGDEAGLADATLQGQLRLTPAGHVLWASQGMERLTGRRVEELTGMELGALVHPEDAPRRCAAVEELARTRSPQTVELRLRQADGSWRWALSTARGLFGPDGGLAELHLSLWDATERRAAQRARTTLQHVFQLAGTGVAVIEPHSNVIVEVNDAFARMHGGRPEDFAGKDLAETVVEDDRDRVGRLSAEAGNRGTVRYETRRRRLDGTAFPAEVEAVVVFENGEPLTRLSYVRDLSERRRAEDALRASERTFRLLAETSGDVLSRSTPDGRVLYMSPAVETLLGLPRTDLDAASSWRLSHPADRGRLRDVRAATVADGRSRTVTVRMHRVSGELLWTQVTFRAVRDTEGRTIEMHTATRDITVQHEAMLERERALALFETSFEQAPIGMLLASCERRVQRVNAATCRLLGRPEHELVGQDVGELLGFGRDVSLRGVEADRHLRRADGARVDVRASIAGVPVTGSGELLLIAQVVDLTDLQRARRDQVAARELLSAVLDHSPTAIYFVDTEERWQLANAECGRIVGRDPSELVGRTLSETFPPDVRAELASHNRDVLRQGEPQRSVEVVVDARTGEPHEFETLKFPVRDSAGAAIGIGGISLDVTERRRFEARTRQLADHDALTGLFNRRRFEEELARELARVRRQGRSACLVHLDVDAFREVNAQFGHAAGDALLARVASAMRTQLREVDILARTGGDEFAAILPDTDVAGGRAAAQKLVAAVREAGQVEEGGERLQATASVGLTAISPDAPADGGEELLLEAGMAVRRAKGRGRQAVVVYEPAPHTGEDLPRHAGWVARLRSALREGRLVLHAQPLVALDRVGNDPDSFELLLRLREGGELLAPASFLPHAERHGIIAELDRWVLGQAVGWLQAAARDGSPLSLAVNLSARTVQDARIGDDLAALLESGPIADGALTVEVTETAAITSVTEAVALGRRLRDLGCRLALDDFGAGFASFSYLKHLRFDVVKIDGDFIERLPSSPTDQLVVRAVVQIARGLGARVIAERVTDKATVDLLRLMGVDSGQGFYLGRPAPPSWA